jgi:hypothetical protein
MVRGSNPVKVQEWVDRLTRRGESDGSVAQFCDAEGVSVASFYQWQRKLRDAAVSKNTKTLAAGSAGGSSASRASASGAGGTNRRVGFQAVDVTSAGALAGALTGALGSSAAAVTVCLPGGIQVQVADNLPAIQAVMRELMSVGRVGSETPAC